MAALVACKDQGKIRALGVSNVLVAELEENIRCGQVVSDQFRYSMLNRDAEKDILPFCAKHNLATLTYMSLEQGLLTGKIGMDRVFQPGEFRANEFWNAWLIRSTAPGPRPAKRVAGIDGQLPMHACATGDCMDRGAARGDPCSGGWAQPRAGDGERQGSATSSSPRW